MPNVAYMCLNGVYYASLGIWAGMTLMIALGAPKVFRILPDRTQAGNVMEGWLGVHYKAALMCGVLASVAAVVRIRKMETTMWQEGWTPAKAIAAVRYALIALMVLNVLYCGWSLAPELSRLRRDLPASREAFDALHHRSTFLTSANLLGAVLVIFLS